MKIGIYNNKNEKKYFNPVWASHLCNNKPEEYSRKQFDLTNTTETETIVEEVEETKVKKTTRKPRKNSKTTKKEEE